MAHKYNVTTCALLSHVTMTSTILNITQPCKIALACLEMKPLEQVCCEILKMSKVQSKGAERNDMHTILEHLKLICRNICKTSGFSAIRISITLHIHFKKNYQRCKPFTAMLLRCTIGIVLN